jgi:sugar lactone lactonase YvrE
MTDRHTREVRTQKGTPRVAAASADMLGESPIWCAREQALYWLDVRAPALQRLVPATGETARWMLPELCGGAVLARGGVVLALQRTLALFDPASSALAPLLVLEDAALDNRLNEAKCDPAGRLWVGSMRDFGTAVTGSLYRVSPALRAARMLGDIRVPNGMAWSPDGTTMYFADTGDGAIRAYAFDPATGDLGAMHILVPPGQLPGRPDGSAVDAEGHLWNARYGGGCIARIRPDGKIDRVVRMPVTQPTSCAFGGADLRTLFVTTARQKLSDAEHAAQPEAGHLLMMPVDVAGLNPSAFLMPV